MSLKHGLLGLLNYGDMTGYELTRVFEDSLAFFWQAQMSQIYRELNAMEKEGWLSSRTVIQTDKPNKKVYSITGAGKAELDRWLFKDLLGEFFTTRNSFLMQLFFSAGKGRKETLATLKRTRDSVGNIMQRTKTIDDSIRFYGKELSKVQDPVYWEMTAQYGRAYYEMCCRWLDDCIRRLEETAGQAGEGEAEE